MPPKKKSLSVSAVNLDAGLAVELLGIRDATEKDEKSYPYVDADGNRKKFVMENNHENRPFSLGLAKDYSGQMLRGEWAGLWNSPSTTGNGETCVVDWNGNVVSMAHRGVAVWLAEMERKRLEKLADGPDSPAQMKLDEYGCNGSIAIPTILVTGVDPLSADTSDTGKNRSLADVIFRRGEFENATESDMRKLATILSVAIKHVSLRIGGYRVKGAPKLHHPKAISFLENHPLLKDVVKFVFEESKGDTDNKRPLDRYQFSLGYVAAHIYLAMYSQAKPERYWKGEMKMDRVPSKDLQAKAEAFWTAFGQIDVVGKKGTPDAVWALKTVLMESMNGNKPLDRDALCTATTRAMIEFLEDEKKSVTTNLLRKGLINAKNEEGFRPEFERFGGLDQERETLLELGLIEEIEVKRVKTDSWKVGDTAWVQQEPGAEPWYGTIQGFSEDGTVAEVYSKDDDEDPEQETCVWGVPVNQLFIDKPEVAEEESEDEEE